MRPGRGDEDGHRRIVVGGGDVDAGEPGEVRDDVVEDVAIGGIFVDALEDDPVLAGLDGCEGIDERLAFGTGAKPGVAVRGAGFEVRLAGGLWIGGEAFGGGEQRRELEGRVVVEAVAELKRLMIKVAGEQGAVSGFVREEFGGRPRRWVR